MNGVMRGATGGATRPGMPQNLRQRGAPVDVIVPVYRDLARTRACIESVLASCNRSPFQLLVIDDASPEPELSAWLRQRSIEAPFECIVHTENRGFVASVNAAMRLHPERDVLLLNSDTVVANDWLDRMLAHLETDPGAGTVTPFSNHATLCSFPIPNTPNALPVGWSTAQLDQLFARQNRGRSLELPTGVGFCLLIRRACLAETGLFDEDRFGRGYGEENDFCLRAQARGWRHRLAGDVFVEHAGGVSFGAERQVLQRAAARCMEALHPGYDARMRAFAQRDSQAGLRRPVAAAVLAESLKASAGKPTVVLHVLGFGGGGSERHVRDLGRLVGTEHGVQHFVLFLAPPSAVLQDLRTGLFYPLNCAAIMEQWQTLLVALCVQVVHWHALNAATLALAECAMPENIREVATLHDIGFADPRAFERGARAEALAAAVPEEGNATQWQQRVKGFLKRMAVVLAPSRYVAQRCHLATAGQTAARVCPHPPMAQYTSVGNIDCSGLTAQCRAAGFVAGRPTVALVGALGAHKGVEHWREIYQHSLRQGAPINWVLVGYADPELRPATFDHLVVHGAFFPADLPALLAGYGVDGVYFPDGMPESFSYALSDVWAAGYPVVAHDRGALAERLRAYPAGGRILPADLSPEQTLVALQDWLSDRAALHTAREALKNDRGDRHAGSEGCRYLEDIWMQVQPERVQEPGHWLELQPLLATHLDDTLFRKELVRLGGEVSALEQRLAAADAAVVALRELAEQRERWAGKLQEDIDHLQQTTQTLAAERRELARQVDDLRRNPCVRLRSWLGDRWRRLRG